MTDEGAPSTIALASFKPKPVIALTALMTSIFFSPTSDKKISNSLCSSAAAASPPAAGAAAAATGAAAVTPNFSSISFTKSTTSITLISEIASSISSLVIAIIYLRFT